jgi:hypothetical protein
MKAITREVSSIEPPRRHFSQPERFSDLRGSKLFQADSKTNEANRLLPVVVMQRFPEPNPDIEQPQTAA